MKKLTKLFIFALVSFVFINTVYADFGKECIEIKETSINTANFDVRMPYCKWEKEPSGWIEVTSPSGHSRYSNYSSAYESGLEVVDSYYETESADGKDMISGHARVPICSSTKRRVVAYSTCTAEIDATPNTITCGDYSSTNCPQTNGCTPTTTGGCVGNWSYTSYSCPKGWEKSENNSKKCVKTIEYGYSGDTPNTVSGTFNAKSACQSIGSGVSCTCSAVEYALECPAYRCDKAYKTLTACTPEFKYGSDYVYCVNPGQHFNKWYRTDTSFNVRSCSNSFVSADCGYANILIEAAYHKNTPNDAINLALRLWSYHTGQEGFEDTGKTGIANREYKNGSCEHSMYFMKEGSRRPNVYANTYEYIMHSKHSTDYFGYAQKIMNKKGYFPGYIADEGAEKSRSQFLGKFKEIRCDGTIGVTCGGGSYRVAFELFFNTLLGNKYMISHLEDLYKNEVGEWVTSTGASLSEEDNKVWVVVEYKNEEFEKVFGEEEIIPCDESNATYQKYKDDIAPYCEMEITYYNQNDQPITDNPVEYCRKNVGCYYSTSYHAICTSESGGSQITKVEVYEYQNPDTTSVRKLIPCGTNQPSQIMYEYVTNPGEAGQEERETVTKTYYTNYNCGGPTSCTQTGVRTTPKKYTCTDNTGEASIADPSLSCIVNMKNKSELKKYDFSDKFGVNTNFCRIYCSDKVDYYIAGKASAKVDRFFTYDVKVGKAKLSSNYKFSAVVKEKRSCVSEVFFNSLPSDVDWKTTYQLTDKENEKLQAKRTWFNLFEIMLEKDYSKLHNIQRTENLNQLVYDLYNCNLYDLNSTTMNNYKIHKPGIYKDDYAWSKIKKAYSNKSDYGNRGLTGSSSDKLEYKGGANYAKYLSSNDGEILGKLGNGKHPLMSVANSADTSNTLLVEFAKTKAKTPIYVKYCKGSKCLKYNEKAEDYSYSEFTIKSETDRYLKTSRGVDYTYPTNDYAFFQAEADFGFYNNEKYQTFENTGNIWIIDNTGRKDDLLDVDEFSYPVSATEFAECTANKKDDGEYEYTCGVDQTINVSPFFRASKVSDDFITAISNKKFSCTVDIKGPTLTACNKTVDWEKCIVWRNVEASKLFPYEDAGEIPPNWKTTEGKAAIEKIQTTADLLQSGDELLEYRITLTPQQIKAIQEYNDKELAGNYTKNRFYINEGMNCITKNVSKDGTRYVECSSEFMQLLVGDDTYGTLSPDYKGTSKYDETHKN